MPGLFGYADLNGSIGSDDAILSKMRNLLIYTGKEHKSEPFFHGDGVHAGYCAPEFENVDDDVAENSGIYCWFDGEIYNADELASLLSTASTRSAPIITGRTAKNMLIDAYNGGVLRDCLGKIDGYFSAVIYDREKNHILLMTDRFGFRHLFYTLIGKNLFWASECKALLNVPGFSVEVDRQSVGEFMKFGFLCGGRTWLDGVRLLDPATVMTFDARSGSVINTCKYRSHDEIVPTTGKFDINEYFEEWGRLFRKSVAQRTVDSERAGLTLSGGLDSRAILAAMPPRTSPSPETSPSGGRINAVTLGDRRCDDARFAAAVCRIKGAEHHVFPLERDGWLARAFLGIWATDGALNLSSQLGVEHLDAISGLMGVCLNGIGGGRMQGGRLAKSSARHEYDTMENGRPGLQMERRWMLRPGFRIDESFFKVRMPFFANELHDFAMALPVDIRKKGNFYRGALLRNFPEYYRKIPWQQAGVPISWPPLMFRAGTFCKRLAGKIARELRDIGLPVRDSKLYFSVGDMLRRRGNFSALRKILTDRAAIWPDYVKIKFPLLSTTGPRVEVDAETLCRIATFEIWMRQANGWDFRHFLSAPCARLPCG